MDVLDSFATQIRLVCVTGPGARTTRSRDVHSVDSLIYTTMVVSVVDCTRYGPSATGNIFAFPPWNYFRMNTRERCFSHPAYYKSCHRSFANILPVPFATIFPLSPRCWRPNDSIFAGTAWNLVRFPPTRWV